MLTKYMQTFVGISTLQASCSKCKLQLDSHTDTSVADDSCLIVCDHGWSVDAYSYDERDEHKHVMTVDTAVNTQVQSLSNVNQVIYKKYYQTT